MKKNNFRNYLINILVIAVLGVLVFSLAMKFGGEGIGDVLKTISFSDVLIILASVLFWQFIIALILVILTRLTHPDYKLKDGLVNVLVATFFHCITPSASGGQIAQFYVYKKQRVDTGDAGSVLWMEFILYQSALTLVSLFFIIIRFSEFYSNFSGLFIFVILGFIINASVIAFLIALAKFEKLHDWIKNKGVYIGVKLHIVKDPEHTIASIENQLNKFRNEIKNYKDHKKTVGICFLLDILRLVAYYAIPFFVFYILKQDLNMELFIDCIAMGSFVAITSSMIPIPGASGGTEMIFVLMFGNLFGQTIASAGMLLWRFATFYFLMIVGLVLFMIVKLKKV